MKKIIIVLLLFFLLFGCTDSNYIINNTRLEKLFDANISGDAGRVPFLNDDGNVLEIDDAFRFDKTLNYLFADRFVIPNNSYYMGTDNGGTTRTIFGMDASNNLLVGGGAFNNITFRNAWNAPILELEPDGEIKIYDDTTRYTILQHKSNNNFQINTSLGGIEYYTGGVLHSFMKGDGTLGIGNSDNEQKVDVYNGYVQTSNNYGYLIEDSASNNKVAMKMSTGNDLLIGDTSGLASVSIRAGNATPAIHAVSSTQRVGINTNNPQRDLHLLGTGTNTVLLIESANNNALQFYESNGITKGMQGYVNGTGLVFNHAEAGTSTLENDLVINETNVRVGNDLNVAGAFRLENGVEDDLMIPAEALSIRGASNIPAWESTVGNLYGLNFDDTTMEQVFFSLQFPHQWDAGTDVEWHIHWGSDGTNTGDVNWCMEYAWENIGDTFGTTDLSCVIDTASGTANDHQLSNVVPITDSASKGYSSVIYGRIFRSADSADDTLTDDAILYSSDLHIVINKLGETIT